MQKNNYNIQGVAFNSFFSPPELAKKLQIGHVGNCVMVEFKEALTLQGRRGSFYITEFAAGTLVLMDNSFYVPGIPLHMVCPHGMALAFIIRDNTQTYCMEYFANGRHIRTIECAENIIRLQTGAMIDAELYSGDTRELIFAMLDTITGTSLCAISPFYTTALYQVELLRITK